MQTIGISEIQKNISLLTKLKEAITIVDKRKNREVAIIYPLSGIREGSVVESMANKYSNKSTVQIEDLEKAKEEAMMMAMREKYGLSD
jgi:hypothetical protein